LNVQCSRKAVGNQRSALTGVHVGRAFRFLVSNQMPTANAMKRIQR